MRERTILMTHLRIVRILAALALTGLAQGALAECGHPSVRFLKSDRISSKTLGYSEPSGLSLGVEADTLLSVSDDMSALFLLDLDGAQGTPPQASFEVDDLEGIALDPVGNRILAVSEAMNGLLVVDAQSGAATQVSLKDMAGYVTVKRDFKTSDPNDGLEGIAVDPQRERIFLLKEKRPRLLLEISMDLTEIRRVTELTPALGFVDDDESDHDLDVSGLSVDAATGCLWIVSDRARRLFLFGPDGDSPARSYPLEWLDGKKRREISHAEGIAQDAQAERLYIVNDDGKASRLFNFEIIRQGEAQ
ncbi:SdiA-regulated domain-containing protein [Tropicimonas sp. TH_r6]|uniref:SdiA-regulated domain-containing protein n=1 Tax=Tropicimonas sp. TH_r6 TaxID=3082085 RepID=UPI0029532CEC|nr:SdiA-regulated domain-containing protein [Tropicimonas sp. TH_r6]MDV7141098.1 SdiA-regulated domain-containing protein [Tropicimonas sp. TH_r6]